MQLISVDDSVAWGDDGVDTSISTTSVMASEFWQENAEIELFVDVMFDGVNSPLLICCKVNPNWSNSIKLFRFKLAMASRKAVPDGRKITNCEEGISFEDEILNAKDDTGNNDRNEQASGIEN